MARFLLASMEVVQGAVMVGVVALLVRPARELPTSDRRLMLALAAAIVAMRALAQWIC